MKHTLVLPVYCVNELANDYPTVFAICLYEDRIGELKKLSQAVNDLGVFTIKKFFDFGTWLSPKNESVCSDIDQLIFKDVVSSDDFEQQEIEMSIVEVSESSFKFTCVPRYLNDDMLISTPDIYFSQLVSGCEN